MAVRSAGGTRARPDGGGSVNQRWTADRGEEAALRANEKRVGSMQGPGRCCRVEVRHGTGQGWAAKAKAKAKAAQPVHTGQRGEGSKVGHEAAVGRGGSSGSGKQRCIWRRATRAVWPKSNAIALVNSRRAVHPDVILGTAETFDLVLGNCWIGLAHSRGHTESEPSRWELSRYAGCNGEQHTQGQHSRRSSSCWDPASRHRCRSPSVHLASSMGCRGDTSACVRVYVRTSACVRACVYVWALLGIL